MAGPKGESLEERVRHTKRSVAILDDNDGDRQLFELYLRKFGEQDNLDLRFVSSNDPDEIFEAATNNTSIQVALIDVFLPDTPPEMKSRYENGLAVAQAIKDVRGKSIDVVLMSGIGGMTEENRRMIISLLGSRYIESLSRTSFVDSSWTKSGRPEEIKNLYDIVKNALFRENDLEYPELIILTGGSGTGKSSVAWGLSKRTPKLRVVASATTRAVRPSEILGPEVPILHQRINHEHLSHDAMYQRIMETADPLIWTSDRRVLTREEYERLSRTGSGKLDFYLYDFGDIDRILDEERTDAMVLTPIVETVKYLRRRYRERSITLVFEASEVSLLDRVTTEGRTHSEILSRMEQERASVQQYRQVGDIFIDTTFHAREFSEAEYNRRRAIDQTRTRASEALLYRRKMPHGIPIQEICTAYAADVEKTLAATAEGNAGKLEKWQTLQLPVETIESFNRDKGSDDAGLLGLVPWLSSVKVVDVKDGRTSRLIHLVASQVAGVPKTVRNEEPWKNALRRRVSFYLDQKGYKAAASDTFHSESDHGSDAVKLVYALSDRHYNLQLIFD